MRASRRQVVVNRLMNVTRRSTIPIWRKEEEPEEEEEEEEEVEAVLQLQPQLQLQLLPLVPLVLLVVVDVVPVVSLQQQHYRDRGCKTDVTTPCGTLSVPARTVVTA